MEIEVASANPCKIDPLTSLVNSVIMTSVFVESKEFKLLGRKPAQQQAPGSGIVSSTTVIEPSVSIWCIVHFVAVLFTSADRI